MHLTLLSLIKVKSDFQFYTCLNKHFSVASVGILGQPRLHIKKAENCK